MTALQRQQDYQWRETVVTAPSVVRSRFMLVFTVRSQYVAFSRLAEVCLRVL